MSGFELSVLRRRVAAEGVHAVTFSYPSISGAMSDHVSALLEFARTQRTERLHFIGHSLGGLVVLRALQLTDDLPPGRAVLLGTPLQGSRAARGVSRLPFGKLILGAAVNEEIIEAASRQWSGRREVGVIAGSTGMGLGKLFATLDSDHDGTVLVEETRMPGCCDHLVLSTSHTGMLFSTEVAGQAAHFLREGRFRR